MEENQCFAIFISPKFGIFLYAWATATVNPTETIVRALAYCEAQLLSAAFRF